MPNNGKLKLSDYDLSDLPEWQFSKIKRAIAKRQRRKDREEKERKNARA